MENLADGITKKIVDAFRNKKCWYASAGGSTSPTFALAFGKKVRRQAPLENEAHPRDYRQYEGEVNLYVWCTWRLDDAESPLTSSDDSEHSIDEALGALLGKKVLDARLERPGWDLHIKFEKELMLHVFSDHVGDTPSFDGNWEVWLKDRAIFFGPGSKHEVEVRERPAT